MAFWKPGAAGPGVDSAVHEENAIETYKTASKHLSIEQFRTSLPVFKHSLPIYNVIEKELLYLVDNYQVVIVVGQTGSGKTTQIPQYLYEANWSRDGKVIACTQPRRVAASSVAIRVAEETSSTLGELVGYAVRFEEKFDPSKTRIKYMTDGLLFREAMFDPLLSRYSVIMIDEAHERSLYTDLLLGLLKKIIKKRPELKIIISSATLDAEKFFLFFNESDKKEKSVEKEKNKKELNQMDKKETIQIDKNGKNSAFILSVQGRMFPVSIFHLSHPIDRYIEELVEIVWKIHTTEADGDILAFVTGREEIERVNELLHEKKGSKALILPLFAGLTMEQQMRVFEKTPNNCRKIIVATNIAEASVTIDNIVYVVDCGYEKIRIFNPKNGMDALVVCEISQASAMQRTGRAGRVRPGKAFRLYTEEKYANMRPNSVPEIQRCNLANVIIQLKALGIENICKFDFISPLSADFVERALEVLYSLQILDENAKLTQPLGYQIAEFPLEPLAAKMLLSSNHYGCSEEILSIAAMLSVPNLFNSNARIEEAKKKFAVEEGDHLTLLNIYNSYCTHKSNPKFYAKFQLNPKALAKASSIRNQLLKYMKKFGMKLMSSKDTVNIRKCIVSGFFSQAAIAQPDGSYRTVRDSSILYIHPSSVLFRRVPKCVVYGEVVETTKAFMRDVCVIEEEWLTQIAPHYYEYSRGEMGRSRE